MSALFNLSILSIYAKSLSVILIYLFSFYPLMAFTLFMAYIHCSSELSKWRKDTNKNGRTVTVLQRTPEGGVNRVQMKRGELRAGDVIEVYHCLSPLPISPSPLLFFVV